MPPGWDTLAAGTRRARSWDSHHHPRAVRSSRSSSAITASARARRASASRRPGAVARPGLRREEVSLLAGVGLSWYTWLEQGRDITPSARCSTRSRACCASGRRARATCSTSPASSCPCPRGAYPAEAPETLRAVVEGLLPNPAYLIGPRTDVLAWNTAAARDARRADPRTRRRPEPPLVDVHRSWRPRHRAAWDDTARNTLARFRAEHARRYGDPAFTALIEALLASQRAVPRAVAAPRGARPRSSARRTSTTRSSGRSYSSTCSRSRRATRTCG